MTYEVTTQPRNLSIYPPTPILYHNLVNRHRIFIMNAFIVTFKLFHPSN